MSERLVRVYIHSTAFSRPTWPHAPSPSICPSFHRPLNTSPLRAEGPEAAAAAAPPLFLGGMVGSAVRCRWMCLLWVGASKQGVVSACERARAAPGGVAASGLAGRLHSFIQGESHRSKAVCCLIVFILSDYRRTNPITNHSLDRHPPPPHPAQARLGRLDFGGRVPDTYVLTISSSPPPPPTPRWVSDEGFPIDANPIQSDPYPFPSPSQ